MGPQTAGVSGPSSELYSEFALRNKTRACKHWFKKCLDIPGLYDDDWLDQKSAEFNWWNSGLNADKSGPGSLDARLKLRPDVKDVVADVLDGLEDALCRYNEIATSDPPILEEEPPNISEADEQLLASDEEERSRSPWSNMSDSSGNHSSPNASDEEDGEEADKNTSSGHNLYREQRVYIETNLETLIRIHTAIKRSGLRFRNQRADDDLKRADEDYQLQKAALGEQQALKGRTGEHEKLRRFLAKLVLWNGYNENLMQRMNYNINTLTAKEYNPGDKGYLELLLQKKLLVVFRAYFYDTARLTTVQRRLINANVVRRNRLIYAGNATKALSRTDEEQKLSLQGKPTTKSAIQRSLLTDQTQTTPAGPLLPPPLISPFTPKRGDSKAGMSFVAQPATDLGSRFTITGALAPPKTNRSAGTKMSARVGNMDYPKCPVEHGEFPCPFCPTILTSEYTKKNKWRGHVAQDLCAYLCVFEDCESPDDMFASTYEWMSHMAKFHSEMEWVCTKCSKNSARDATTSSFDKPAQLKEHILASHKVMDHSELDLLVEAGKRTVGIQKVRCPLCRAGLVTLETPVKGEDDEGDSSSNCSIELACPSQEVGLIQLEEDDHIATHIHEFALHSFPSLEEATSEKSQASLSQSRSSTREEILFQGSRDPDEEKAMYSWSDIDSFFKGIKRELATVFVMWESSTKDSQEPNDIESYIELFTAAESRFYLWKENVDLDAFAVVLNETRVVISQHKDSFSDPNVVLQYEGLRDDLDSNQKCLFSILEDAAASRIESNMAFDEAPDIASDPNSSCWDIAYDTLKEENPKLIFGYEDLLSRVSIGASHETEEAGEVTNQIPQHNAVARREKFQQISKLGLRHMENKKVSTTLLGHEIVLQHVLVNVGRVVKWTEDYIKDIVKDLPYASIVVAGVSLILPLLENPSAAEAANQDGFIYVTSQMRYYVAMESTLVFENIESGLKNNLTDRLIDLYKLIINFQVRTVLRFYHYRTMNFSRGTIYNDSWDQKLQSIKDCDRDLFLKFKMAMSASSLEYLKYLTLEAEASRTGLYRLLKEQEEPVEVSRDNLSVSRDHISFVQKMDSILSDTENRTCLQHLQVTDPRMDKTRIEQQKGGLLKDSYHWVFDHAHFQRWRNDGQNQMLWITGGPGQGKTMMLCGIINELIESTMSTTNVSFFFCEASNNYLNNNTLVLRGLIYMLVNQQPPLISYVRESYDSFGKQCFEDSNAFITLSKILIGILGDPALRTTYLIVDALDECITDLDPLLGLVQKSLAYSSVKWIVSSRKIPSIEMVLHKTIGEGSLHLDVNETSAGINSYIQFQIQSLTMKRKYVTELHNFIQHYLSSNANGTYLWVALVCKELDKRPNLEVKRILISLPSGLYELYSRMMDQISNSIDSHLYKGTLAVVSVAYQSITLDELPCFIDIPLRNYSDHETLAEIIEDCGSFLTLQERNIYFIHQSAKDFLSSEFNNIFDSTVQNINHIIFERSLQVMSKTLQHDIYGLRAPGFSIDLFVQPDRDPLAAVRYSCLYWIDHLLGSETRENPSDDLMDDGPVDRFLRKSFLYWLEALCLMRSLSKGIAMIEKLENRLEADKCPRLYAFILDAKQFILYNQPAIEQTPLQLYYSALFFAPTESIIQRRFKHHYPPWIQTRPNVQLIWSKAAEPLEGHLNSVKSVAFSPDSKQVVSGSTDQMIRLWDVSTGFLERTIEGHSGLVVSVIFSHDSKLIASASSDATVRIWDAATGSLEVTLVGHSHWVKSVAFSPDGKQVVSGSYDNTIRLWDIVIGDLLQTLEGHSESVDSVAFSPDGKQVASGSADKTIRLWDTSTGSPQMTLEGHSGSVVTVVFSHYSKLIASASSDGTVKIWNADTGYFLQEINVDTSILSFDSTDSFLITDVGRIKLNKSWPVDLLNPSREGSGSSDCEGLGNSDSWITWNGQNLLWLPHDYRSSTFAFSPSSSIIAIGCRSGRVVVIGFSSANINLGE